MRSATRLRTGKDRSYLAFLHDQPCVICKMQDDFARLLGGSVTQKTRTEAAHVGERGLSPKCPDREAIPLCTFHHQDQHARGKVFWTFHGLDKEEVIERYNHLFEVNG